MLPDRMSHSIVVFIFVYMLIQSNSKIAKITFTSFVILFTFVWSFPTIACGCGVLIMDSENEQGWEYGNDSTETALISYKDGTEHLLIGLDVQPRNAGAALITPVPAKPNTVQSDILPSTPTFEGFDISDRGAENIVKIRNSLVSSQLYPLIFWIIYNLTFSSHGLQVEAIAVSVPRAGDGFAQGVEVYQHIEKEGMIAEVLSAKTSDALYNYLRMKGLAITQDSIPIFRDYIRDDYSFVVAWIDPAQNNLTAKAVAVSFPTDTLYYPLKPNSAYTGEGKPKEILVAGYVSPRLPVRLEQQTRVSYHYDADPTPFENFIPKTSGFGFTRVLIRANPSLMTEDLTFSRVASPAVYIAHGAAVHPIIFGILILLLIAYLATRFSLMVSRPQFSRPILPHVLTLTNSLTLIGTIIAARRYLVTSRFTYVTSYSIAFVVLAVVLSEILRMVIASLHYIVI